jgi:adiponectin receptor
MFAFRFPEAWFPGRCDIWFHSHQWMHICVVAAAFIHWMGLVELLKIRLHTPCLDI